MSTKVNVPPPTAEETGLRVEQTNLLRMQRELILQQNKQQNALLPIFAKQMGLTLKFDKQGNIIGATPLPAKVEQETLQQRLQTQVLRDLLDPKKRAAEQSLQQRQMSLLDLQMKDLIEQRTGPLAQQNKEIQKLANARTLKALKGQLEIDPALERDIKSQGEALKDRLRQQFGAGYETSSPGIEALQKFEEGANVLRSQARRGELTLSEQLAASRAGIDSAMGGMSLGAGGMKLPGVDPLAAGGFAFGMQQGGQQSDAVLRQVLASPLGIAGGLGQVASGFQMPIGSYMNDRQMQLNANIQNSQNSMAGLGALGSIFGGLLALSDIRLKYNVGQIGEWEGIPIVTYRYTFGGPARIGMIAQDVQESRPEAVVVIGGFLAINYGAL